MRRTIALVLVLALFGARSGHAADSALGWSYKYVLTTTTVDTQLVPVMSGIVAAYVWPRAEVRFERLFVATFGALVGSLIGRVLSDPSWVGHLFYVAAGAFAFSALDWIRRRHRSLR